jgi:hypothetical protein
VHDFAPLCHTFPAGIVQLKANPEALAFLHRFYPYGLPNQFQVFFPVVHRDGNIQLAALGYGMGDIDSQPALRDIDGFTSENRVIGFRAAAPANDFNEYRLNYFNTLILASIGVVSGHKLPLPVTCLPESIEKIGTVGVNIMIFLRVDRLLKQIKARRCENSPASCASWR